MPKSEYPNAKFVEFAIRRKKSARDADAKFPPQVDQYWFNSVV
jgi:hypothetical protein